MNVAHAVTMDATGGVVIPPDLRERFGLRPGDPIVLAATARGLLILSRDQAKAVVREGLSGADLVGELLIERRRAAGD